MKKTTRRYLLKDIDVDLWKDFKALAALEGVTVKEKLLKYIASEVHLFRSTKLKKTMLAKPSKKGGK